MQGSATAINHSGGSQGADAAWREEGVSYGVTTVSYRPFDDPQLQDPTSLVLDQVTLLEADEAILAADAILQAGFQDLPEREKNYIRRNWWQAKMAQVVCAVARVLRRKESGLACDCVAGGSAWVFLMAAHLGKPVYVFDDEEGCDTTCTRRWYALDHASGRLALLPARPPRLTHNFASVGTRTLGAAGASAIRQLLAASFQPGKT